MTHYQDVMKIHRQARAVLLAAFLFFLLAAMTQAGADRDYGLLWEVSKADAEPAYLFGTIHSEDPAVLQLAQPVQQAFESSQIVVLEMLLDMEAMMYSSSAMLMMDGWSFTVRGYWSTPVQAGVRGDSITWYSGAGP